MPSPSRAVATSSSASLETSSLTSLPRSSRYAVSFSQAQLKVAFILTTCLHCRTLSRLSTPFSVTSQGFLFWLPFSADSTVLSPASSVVLRAFSLMSSKSSLSCMSIPLYIVESFVTVTSFLQAQERRQAPVRPRFRPYPRLPRLVIL